MQDVLNLPQKEIYDIKKDTNNAIYFGDAFVGS